jgi:hypothetical protein
MQPDTPDIGKSAPGPVPVVKSPPKHMEAQGFVSKNQRLEKPGRKTVVHRG